MMTTVILYIVVSLAAGVCAGVLLMWLLQRRAERESLRTELDLQAERNRCGELQAELQEQKGVAEGLQAEVRLLAAEKSRLEAEGRSLAERYEEKTGLCRQYAEDMAALRREADAANAGRIRLDADYRALQEKLETQRAEIEKLHEQTLAQFKVMASNIMEEKSRAFKELNGESLKTILDPLNRDIESFRKQVSQCYDTESKERSSLQEQIRQLTMQNEGNAGINGGPNGNLVIIFKVKPHPLFVRQGNDLNMELPISVTQAILGDTVEIPTLTGPVKIEIPEGTQDGAVIRVKNRGVKNLRRDSYGDLYVRVTVDVPKNLGSRQRKQLEELKEILDKGRYDKIEKYRKKLKEL